MSFASFLVRDVTIVRPGSTTDAHNNAVPDWSSATRTDAKAWRAQTSATETLGERDAFVDLEVLSLAAGTDVLAGDRVEMDGETFGVDGRPNRVHTRQGEHHVEVRLVRVAG